MIPCAKILVRSCAFQRFGIVPVCYDVTPLNGIAAGVSGWATSRGPVFAVSRHVESCSWGHHKRNVSGILVNKQNATSES
jgi:hypothetical protein